jgi:hypothetical protein
MKAVKAVTAVTAETLAPIAPVKTIKAKPKRLAKGERIHNRRVKQAARKGGTAGV